MRPDTLSSEGLLPQRDLTWYQELPSASHAVIAYRLNLLHFATIK